MAGRQGNGKKKRKGTRRDRQMDRRIQEEKLEGERREGGAEENR